MDGQTTGPHDGKRWRKRLVAISSSPRATWWMALLSFTESCVFIIPPDVMLVPMYLAKPQDAYRNAFICTVASLLGGIVGYFLGMLLLREFAMPLIEFYGAGDAYQHFKHLANGPLGVILIASKGLTPIPYKIVAIASGAAGMNLGFFLLASLIGRGTRFFALAWIARHYGNGMRAVMATHGTKLTLIFVAVLIVGVLMVSLL